MIQVKQGYNQLAKRYQIEREQLKSGKYVGQLIKRLPRGASVLDIGCGDGVPTAVELSRKGLLVTGIDLAEKMVVLAKKNCPTGEFLVRDMMTLKREEFQVQAVVCMYALFHIPRTKHFELLEIINSFLPKGGLLLITMGDKDFEGEHNSYGVRLWSSHFGPKKNLEIVEAAGFEVWLETMDTSGQERHQVILGVKQ